MHPRSALRSRRRSAENGSAAQRSFTVSAEGLRHVARGGARIGHARALYVQNVQSSDKTAYDAFG